MPALEPHDDLSSTDELLPGSSLQTAKWKYATLRDGKHNRGRLTVTFAVDSDQRTFTVTLKRAQDISAAPSLQFPLGLRVHSRVQIKNTPNLLHALEVRHTPILGLFLSCLKPCSLFYLTVSAH